MDLGCIDMGCVEKPIKEASLEKDIGLKEDVMSASKSAKNSKTKDAVRSSLNALTKITSQISKPHRRKTSPVNWFPRKKVEPYLKRKIKMLQEVDGMRSTLDETLGDSNPHYSRVFREKIAIREAAEKAMEARKSAMVEASWCRIIQAARIENKEAEAQLANAEKLASEASEAARAVGVIMDDSQNQCKIETSGGPITTHTVSATLETAFEVDKQVAAAVKDAFIKLASCPSINKEEFKDLLRKISENPETDENLNDVLDFTLDCESGIVDMMFGRLSCLKEDELSSLATIVATRGLNAALSEKGNDSNKRSSLSSSSVENAENSRLKAQSRRMSVGGRRISSAAEILSLDKFLVKSLTKLERDVLEAKNAQKNENEKKLITRDEKLEKDVGGARACRLSETGDNRKFKRVGPHANLDSKEVPSLDKFLVKHLTRLEREVEEAKNGGRAFEAAVKTASFLTNKENMDTNKTENRGTSSNVHHKDGGLSSYGESLDKVLVKHLSKLEKEKLNFVADEQMRIKPKKSKETCGNSEGSLDQVLIKHKSRIEREKMSDEISSEQQGKDGDGTTYLVSRRQARERELEAAWGGLSLGNSMKPHVSRLQRDKEAWLKAEEEAKKMAMEKEQV